MNTSQLKTFAQKARNIIRDGVSRQLKYWGFDEKGKVECRPEKVEGGFIHREEIIDDPSVMKRWEALNQAVKHQGFDQVVEEAAYTWFNRMMAIRILSKNGYDIPQLEYGADGAQTPLMLQRARRGQFAFLNKEEQTRLKQILPDYTKDTQAFAILLTGYCHSHSLLNNIFGRLDDYTELLLPVNMLNETGFIHFLNTTSAISDEDYRQVELIGWLYQFYISEKKDQVFAQFKKNQKAEAKDIPAATQIFTPNWIVKYMVENTVGKIWLDQHPESPIRATMKYLVESPTENVIANREERSGKQSLINEVANLKLLDPAAGSGHILVEGFELLFQMYLEEYYMPEEAVESILINNLFGLDIDLRAAQLARFAILMKAASKYPEILKKNIMPKVFAMPAPANFSRQDILDFLGSEGRPYEEKLSEALQLMQQAQNLGSVMKFDFSADERIFIVARLEDLKSKAFRDNLEEVLLQKITPYIEVLAVLIDKYEAIAANPPYMQSKNYNKELKNYIDINYPNSKSDLFAVFMDFSLNRIKKNGFLSEITMQSWMFLGSFNHLREEIVSNTSIIGIIDVGWNIFDNHSFPTAIFVVNRDRSYSKYGEYIDLTNTKNENEKLNEYKKERNHFIVNQDEFKSIPNFPVSSYWLTHNERILFNRDKLNCVGAGKKGLSTGKNDLFVKYWNEINYHDITLTNKDLGKSWVPLCKGGSFRKWYGNNDTVIFWLEKGAKVKNFSGSVIRNEGYYYKPCIAWGMVSYVNFSSRIQNEGFIFEGGGPCFFSENLIYIQGFLSTKIVQRLLKAINPSINYNITDVENLPFIQEKEEIVELFVSNCVQISKTDWDSRESSWDFRQNYLLSCNNDLFKGVVKSTDFLEIKYKFWIEKVTKDFYQLHANEEELNQIFINIYGLNEDLDPIVPLKDITILQEELDIKSLGKTEKALLKKRQWKLVEGKWQLFVDETKPLPELPIKRDVVMKQLVSYAIGCMMGRYRLDQPGLHIAHPNPSPEEVCTYDYNGYPFEIDDDGIIPLMGSNCTFADDAVNRFNYFLEVVWGAETLTQNKNFLVDCLNQKTENQEIEKYLVKDFWKDHCQTYKKKPIYWLFASPKGAFQVLVYMHRMNRFTAEKIRSKYLLKHLQYLQQEIDLMENRSGLSRDEQKRLDTLHTQYDECVPYELLLKDCADRQIPFDLDDGVTVNYELFKGVVANIK